MKNMQIKDTLRKSVTKRRTVSWIGRLELPNTIQVLVSAVRPRHLRSKLQINKLHH